MLLVKEDITIPRPIARYLDFNTVELRRVARRSKDAAQARRLLALAAIYDGGTRSRQRCWAR